MMNEKLLQFIWRFKYFSTKDLKTLQGDAIHIVHAGNYNINQGPDFLDAKIKLDSITLAGNIELHVKSSDWYKHQHQKDSNYKNIVLHVVWQHDIADTQIASYPIVELKQYVSKLMVYQYEQLMTQYQFIPCEKQIQSISSLSFNNWKERLLVERLEQKTDKIFQSLKNNKGGWEETFWQKLAANFGIKVNSDAFESMAQATPALVLAKNKLSLVKLEAILFGQAGLLNEQFHDDYAILLQKEYQFLKNKYQLQSGHIPAMFLRMRPFNFPTIRLSQLAQLIFVNSKMFSKILECTTYKEVMELLHVKANDYWHYHYKLDDEPTAYKEKYVGEDMQHNIIINTIAPILFAYGMYKNEEQYKQRAILWLENIPAEINHITKGFRQLEIKSKTAADSQALIQLKNHYCNAKKCLDCTVGAKILKPEK